MEGVRDRETNALTLERKIRQYNRDYAAGTPSIPDWQYDAELDRLRELKPNSKVLKEVGYQPQDGDPGEKIKLPLKMGSLHKKRPQEVIEWLQKTLSKLFKTSTAIAVALSPKLDGIAGLLHYRNGKLIAAYKRGNGRIGVNVTKLARHVTGVIQDSVDCFGKKRGRAFYITGDYFVKGEFIIHTSIFTTKYKDRLIFKDQTDPYANARNFVAGMFNRQTVDDTMQGVLKDICFIAYDHEARGGDMPQKYNEQDKLEKLRMMEMLGFITVICPKYPRSPEREAEIQKLYTQRYNARTDEKRQEIDQKIQSAYNDNPSETVRIATVVYNDHKHLTETTLVHMLIRNKVDLDLLQDGLVIDILDKKVRDKLGFDSEGLRPNFAMSIKLDRKDQIAQTGECDHVYYKYSKRGLLKPKVILKEPLVFDGVKVTNATAHNWKFVFDNQIGPGTKLTIIRSGDVIPFILEVQEATHAQRPMRCPFCNTRLMRNKNDLYCWNADCSGRTYAQLQAFFDIVEVDGMSEGTLERLFLNGIDTVHKVFSLTATDLLKIEGFADKKAAAIPAAIKKSVENIGLARLQHGSTIYSRESYSLGETRLSDIINHFGAKTVLSRRDFRVDEILEIHGMGLASATMFTKCHPHFLDFYETIKPWVTLRDLQKKAGKLKGLFFCFTGFRNKNLAKEIEDQGGQIVGTVAQSRGDKTILFAKEESKKTEAAKKVGATIVSMDKAEAWIHRKVA